MIKISNYINGELSIPSNKKYIDIYNPSTGNIYAQCPNSEKKDLENAIKSAELSFLKWSNLTQKNRSDFLFKIADLIEKDLDEFAKSESTDNGKPYKLSQSLDIPRSIKNLRFFASIANTIESEPYHKGNVVSHILRQPLGLVATISPFSSFN